MLAPQWSTSGSVSGLEASHDAPVEERMLRSVVHLSVLAALQAALSGWWLWISGSGGDKLVPQERGLLLLVSGPAAWFAPGSVVWPVFAVCTFVLFALLIAAAPERHRPARPVIIA